MEFRELRYFLGVAKEKNITKAAELLNTTQPNLTRQMRKTPVYPRKTAADTDRRRAAASEAGGGNPWTLPSDRERAALHSLRHRRRGCHRQCRIVFT